MKINIRETVIRLLLLFLGLIIAHLGVTLFPQAGVALGMVVTAQALGEDMGHMVRNIILFSVLVYELVGPMLTKLALTKSGEIEAAASDEQNRARFEKKLHHRAKRC